MRVPVHASAHWVCHRLRYMSFRLVGLLSRPKRYYVDLLAGRRTLDNVALEDDCGSMQAVEALSAMQFMKLPSQITSSMPSCLPMSLPASQPGLERMRSRHACCKRVVIAGFLKPG